LNNLAHPERVQKNGRIIEDAPALRKVKLL
jgi:hypothetical protein